MRRVLRSKSQKVRAKRRAEYELEQRRSRPARLRAYHASFDTGVREEPRLPHGLPSWSFRRLAGPEVFSLVDNVEEVLRYFSEAHRLLGLGVRVRFDLSATKRVTPDAVALLAACVNSKAFRCGRPVAGDAPKDEIGAQMFDESGFYSHVRTRRQMPAGSRHLMLHRITRSRVENELAVQAAQTAVRHIFADGRRVKPLYEVLIECMANTNNHAGLKKRGMYDWWLFVYNDPAQKRTVFVFLDLGVGIFESLPVKRAWMALSHLGLKSNTELWPKLLSGEISSRTGKSERGKGIPKISLHAHGGTFSRFEMFANNVRVDLLTDTCGELSVPLGGTLFYFEMIATQ